MANKGRKLGFKEKLVDPLFTEEMSSLLLRRDEIALLSGMSAATYFARLKEQTNLLEAILRGRARTRVALYGKAFELARQGDMEAIKFLSAKLDRMDSNTHMDLLDHIDQLEDSETDKSENIE